MNQIDELETAVHHAIQSDSNAIESSYKPIKVGDIVRIESRKQNGSLTATGYWRVLDLYPQYFSQKRLDEIAADVEYFRSSDRPRDKKWAEILITCYGDKVVGDKDSPHLWCEKVMSENYVVIQRKIRQQFESTDCTKVTRMFVSELYQDTIAKLEFLLPDSE